MRIPTQIVAIAALSLVAYATAPQAMQHTQYLASAVAESTDSPFQGEAAEHFLTTARITDVRPLGEGITRPLKVALELDDVAHKAVFKFVDERRMGVIELSDGSTVFGFRDTWETEVAAYRIDRMIGLGMVPATVEREVEGGEGSLQWWATSMMSEADRIEQNVRPPGMQAWNLRRMKVWLFDELISNADRHMNNLLITEDFEIRLIDHSRSFRDNERCRNPERLTRFSRSLLEGIERLTFDNLKVEIGRHVSDDGIRRLLDRRDHILELARQRVAEFGEAAVLYP